MTAPTPLITRPAPPRTHPRQDERCFSCVHDIEAQAHIEGHDLRSGYAISELWDAIGVKAHEDPDLFRHALRLVEMSDPHTAAILPFKRA